MEVIIDRKNNDHSKTTTAKHQLKIAIKEKKHSALYYTTVEKFNNQFNYKNIA